MTSNAKAYFDDILGQADPFAYLCRIATSGEFETEWLDFKMPPLPQDALKTWSEAVAGFANTEGGVIIFGIDCRKVDNVDASCGVALVDDLAAFKTRLNQNIHQTTDPPLQGIRIELIHQPNTDKGFAVCFIPQGTNKPYRSEQAKPKRYLIRVGDSFVDPNPALLRALFYPQSTPDLRVLIQCDWSEGFAENRLTPPSTHGLQFFVTVINAGSISAENTVLACRNSDVIQPRWETQSGSWGLMLTEDGYRCYFSKHAIHPRMHSPAVFLGCNLKAKTSSSSRVRPDGQVEFDFYVYSKDMQPKRFQAKFSTLDIREKKQKYADVVIE